MNVCWYEFFVLHASTASGKTNHEGIPVICIYVYIIYIYIYNRYRGTTIGFHIQLGLFSTKGINKGW